MTIAVFPGVDTKLIFTEQPHNFDKYTTQEAFDFGVPYDYDSVMHYQDTAFVSEDGRRRGAKSVVPKKPGVKIGNRLYLSEMDALKINRMYECSGQIQTKTSTTESPIAYVGPIDHGILCWPFFFEHM
ncbi:unnamed protein product [Allacma fusca]|uniref:Peptidase M12A domain-containing protein n=1 Tax=Allacma fusca TaxID=39272 RepID=A0A8J2L3U2_9HEXA|nr:unnamed protein product [Allacma fusca]